MVRVSTIEKKKTKLNINFQIILADVDDTNNTKNLRRMEKIISNTITSSDIL